MDEELFGPDSVLPSSFESDGGGGVDVEANMLKYLLESHAAQLGAAAGPASLLLSQLGINLPAPPRPQFKQNNQTV